MSSAAFVFFFRACSDPGYSTVRRRVSSFTRRGSVLESMEVLMHLLSILYVAFPAQRHHVSTPTCSQ